ncbi:bifunctional 5-dehydro-2-deoxygluconokinase/5-dehydro-2-deoxyphosphogluconate aldolase [Aureimonas psammosilenae]|uniref:bifunctional 5-dehydro-2-deoxygluconokinase/5-dehydro-2- deoxyphosphogluconate aldolase n=1 Tax=Aureimonas psammosilenae TaxID=2495496 RepID=UPI001260DD3D|nr:5-dehydro-2-deoxygluconokinase [Aureimonas psammosilenae]
MAKPLDVVTIGRCSVDLYGQQIGSRLEDIASFAKSVGGCPANIAIGTARLGLKSALLTRVGPEQMGGFVREQLAREGVETKGVTTDPERLTALVLLAVEDEGVSPMIFYRTDCADMALCEEDVSEELIASAASIVVTGTHFSKPNTEAAQLKAIRIAKANGGKVVFDVDYRPNLWGLAGHAAGFERYVASDAVSKKLQAVLPDCDLVVGTEEEMMIAGGVDDPLEALKAIRAVSSATLVLKRGAMGCIIFEGPISSLDDGIAGRGFPIEVFNVLGAGDAFMSGLLAGWLRGKSPAECATMANACGAFAVSRLLCSPEYPTIAELDAFLAKSEVKRRLRQDEDLNHIHWATTRRPGPERLMALACDHRMQIEEIADAAGVSRDRIEDFKVLAVEAAAAVAGGEPGFGVLLDGTYGRRALFKASAHGFWIGRPVEKPGSRPLDFDQMADLGSHLTQWPLDHVIKCLCFYHPDDSADLKARQERELLRLYDAARTAGRELLVEIIAGKHGPLADDTVATIVERIYDLGIKPDWWKLEPQKSAAAWERIQGVIAAHDPYCRGIVLLGLEAPEAELAEAFQAVAAVPMVKGFAVGRTIFSDAARRWFAGEIGDKEAVDDMARRFGTLVSAWRGSREQAKAA